MTAPLTILLTGFEPFPSAPLNPTEDLVRMIERGEIVAPEGVRLFASVLPVEFEASWAKLAELIEDVGGHVVLNFGLSAKATGFTLERLARNEIKANRPDNAGVLTPPRAICENGADIHASRLPLDALAEALGRESLPVDHSDNAGGYVCNHLFYQSMSAGTEVGGFIHVPYLDEQRDALEASGDIPKGHAALTREQLRRGVEVILEVLAGLPSPGGEGGPRP